MKRLIHSCVISVLLAGAITGLPTAGSATTISGLNGLLATVIGGKAVVIDPATGWKETVVPEHALGRPSWAPDGRLAVDTWEGTDLVNIKNGSTTPVPGCGGNPSLSPDGLWAACTETDRHVTVTALDGSSTQMIVEQGFSPEWSPDGAWIAYRFWSGDGSGSQVWKIRPDGSDATVLTSLVDLYPDGPLSWSPDSSTIAFTATSTGGTPRIATVPASGGDVTYLTDGSAGRSNPSWSPDGARLAVSVGSGGLATISATGTDFTPVPNVTAYDRQPAWQPAALVSSSSRHVVDAGRSVQLSFTLGSPQENRDVVLQRRTPNGAWSTFATKTADPAGDLDVSVRVVRTTWFRALWTGDSEHVAAAGVPQLVEARLVLSGGLKRAYAHDGKWHLYHVGKRVLLIVSLFPAKPDDKVCFPLERWTGSRWASVSSPCFRTFTLKGESAAGIMWTGLPKGFKGRISASWDPTAQKPDDTANLGDSLGWQYFRITR
jgi:hypothetical protein